MSVLLRRHVVRRTDAGTGQIDFLIKHFRDSKISKFDSLIGDEDVGCLEIPMQYSLIMHIKDSQCDLSGPIYDLLLLQLLPTLTLLLLNYKLIEIPTRAELHDDVEFLPLDDGLAVRYDVDMFECL